MRYHPAAILINLSPISTDNMQTKEWKELMELYEEITRLGQVSSLLMWDQNTYMPQGSIRSRAAQNALITGLVHQRYTSDRLGELLSAVGSMELDEDRKAIHREIDREQKRRRSVPEKLAKDISRTEAEGNQAWVKAKKENDFGAFAPILEKMIGLKKDLAECVGYKEAPYDALLDEFEPYMTCSEVDSIFTDLRKKLVPIVERITGSGIEIDASPLKGDMPKGKQLQFSEVILKDMGYDFSIGRIDETEHPFTVGSMDDVRITTRFDEGDIRNGLFACIHEGGHALYEQGYEEGNFCTPLSEAASLGIHESQSRFWENMVGRSLGFWERYLTGGKGLFPEWKDKEPMDLFKAVNRVQPSLVRVEADEVTYNLHVLIRYEIEKEIFSGTLDVKDIPQVWNDRYENYLGVRPSTDTEGCLQDVHWSVGYFGYFPTYTLGNLYSAMLREAIIKEKGDLEQIVKDGELNKVLSWLRSNVHRHGRRYPAKDLIKRITAKGLSAEPFIEYLKNKYSHVYGISL